MTAVTEQSAVAAAGAVVAAVGEVVGAYAIGSVATGGFEPGTSDLDVVVVLPGQPSRSHLDAVAERVRAVDVSPARGLELVAYADGKVVLNVNTGPGMTEHVGYAGDDPEFWFVLDRAVAAQRAVTLVGPPWSELFAPVSRDQVLAALRASLDWHAAEEPASRNTVLNTVRTWRWLETGDWVSKPEAADWLLSRVRERVEEAR